jgi:hypothetical protein
MSKIVSLFFFTILFVSFVHAQEVDCNVTVNFESLPAANKDLLVNFLSDVRSYVSNYKWGPETIDEKISCALQINIKTVSGENRYTAEVFVGSSRSIFNGAKNSAMLRLFDDAWEFTYVNNRPIIHAQSTYNDLASFLDFYMQLIIGYDYDSYIEMGGTPYFQKAADIASLARSTGGKGWQQAKSGYSRLQLIDEILNSKFAPMRIATHRYHFTGLDSLATSKDVAQKNIVDAIRMIGALKKTADPRNQIIRTFFDAKYQEVSETLIGYSDPRIFVELATMDPSHQNTYEEYRKKR